MRKQKQEKQKMRRGNLDEKNTEKPLAIVVQRLIKCTILQKVQKKYAKSAKIHANFSTYNVEGKEALELIKPRNLAIQRLI
jgi:hypothetical protein